MNGQERALQYQTPAENLLSVLRQLIKSRSRSFRSSLLFKSCAPALPQRAIALLLIQSLRGSHVRFGFEKKIFPRYLNLPHN